jgi:Protein of unknown function (DUF2844)
VRRQFVVSSVLFCACVAMSQTGWAALGGTLATVRADEVHMHATRSVADHAGYEVHELVLGSGTVVREFASPAGRVFGVAWQGPFKPDLNQLLGEHFPRLVAAGQGPRRDHRALKVQAGDLVIESDGRMRAFAGRAYLPALVPATVSLDDIR